ncbi:MAG: hypothetical protein EA428_00160 [Spirochaetaceae bacterium]|nr:MAG: hypothetical protein EA428_00160 [Spirochaetaceae bacterium]
MMRLLRSVPFGLLIVLVLLSSPQRLAADPGPTSASAGTAVPVGPGGSELPRVGVFPTVNSTGAEQYDAVGRVIYDTTVLTLRLIGAYELVELPPAERLPSETELLERAREQNLANIVLADIRLDQGELALEMSVFDTLQERITLSQREDPPGLLAVFEATDTLVAELVEEFSGVPVGFATLVLRNAGEPGRYNVYLDGEPLGQDIRRVERILMGERRVEIRQQRMIGEYIVHTESVLLGAGEQRELAFSIPYLIERERLVLESFERQIQSEIERPQNEQRIEQLFADVEATLAEISYSPNLTAERQRFAELHELWQQDFEAWSLRLRPRWVFPVSVGYSFAPGSWDDYYPEPGPISVVGASRRFGQRLYLGIDIFMLSHIPVPAPMLALGWHPTGSAMSYQVSAVAVPDEAEGSPILLKAGVTYRRYSLHLHLARQGPGRNIILGPLVGLRF